MAEWIETQQEQEEELVCLNFTVHDTNAKLKR